MNRKIFTLLIMLTLSVVAKAYWDDDEWYEWNDEQGYGLKFGNFDDERMECDVIGSWWKGAIEYYTGVVEVPEKIEGYTVTGVGTSAFDYYVGGRMSEVVLPNTITHIEAMAFEYNENLRKVNIPSGVVEIGRNAFAGCSNLQSVYSYIATPYVIDHEIFSRYNATLYVPTGTKELYQQTFPWSSFQRIEEFDTTTGMAVARQQSCGNEPAAYYSLSGERLAAPQHGVNIVRTADGQTRKVVVK